MTEYISLEDLPFYPMEDVRKAVKKRIDELQEKGINVGKLAEETGIDRSTIDKFLSGKTRDIKYTTLCKLLNALKYPQLLKIRAKDIMSPVQCLHKEDKVLEAIKLMVEKHFCQLPVLDENESLVGEFTVDTVKRLFLKFRIEEIVDEQNPLKVGDVMDEPPPVFPPDSSLSEVWDALKYNYYILVGKPGYKPIGIITKRDPLRRLYQEIANRRGGRSVRAESQ